VQKLPWVMKPADEVCSQHNSKLSQILRQCTRITLRKGGLLAILRTEEAVKSSQVNINLFHKILKTRLLQALNNKVRESRILS
jgi:hypothetical protein